MKTEQIYTREEVLKNINFFNEREDNLLIKRAEINKAIREARNQKQHWIDLDLSQLKLL